MLLPWMFHSRPGSRKKWGLSFIHVLLCPDFRFLFVSLPLLSPPLHFTVRGNKLDAFPPLIQIIAAAVEQLVPVVIVAAPVVAAAVVPAAPVAALVTAADFFFFFAVSSVVGRDDTLVAASAVAVVTGRV